jgi:hypothetical protein
MKFPYQLIAAMFILLVWGSCKKEHEILEKNRPASEQLHTAEAFLLGCDDTTTFKSSVDLQPLEYLRNCYVCTAIKQVPGLGEIPWKANCMVNIVDTMFRFGFYTYEPWFEELLPREELSFVYMPMSIGVHPVDNWLQNSGHYVRLWGDGDLVGAGWETDTICVSYIKLTRIDLDNEEIEGEFEIHLKLKYPDLTGILHSERINFINGKFTAEIED